MGDQSNKKPFIIPKTRTFNKDVLITEKIDSRNVTELFADMKSCALDTHFDFRQNQCKSCDTIRNQKLQKAYNERRIQMKKEQEPTERFAFHLIKSRDTALNIATDGVQCEQLSFSIETCLGNPSDGVHLSRRPDIVLASSNAQGLHEFGLLVCKILLGKGYATMPSISNKQLCAQLHYDYHFCKIQSGNKEQHQIHELLANSLIFCFEHEDFKTIPRPSQILPIAIVWYNTFEKFTSQIFPSTQESKKHHKRNSKLKDSYNVRPISKPTSSITSGTWDDLTKPRHNVSTSENSPIKCPDKTNACSSFSYTTFSNFEQQSHPKDPRLIRKTNSSDSIPTSPQNSVTERTCSSNSLLFQQSNNEKDDSLIEIPLNSADQLFDPRLKDLKQRKTIFFLQSAAVEHAIQKQKRLNSYFDLKNGCTPKTSYTLIPFLSKTISMDENLSMKETSRTNSLIIDSSLFVSVVDCSHFGFNRSEEQLFIDLEDNGNRLAYEQLIISNQLIEREKMLNSKEIRLNKRESHQKKLLEQMNERRKNESSLSKHFIYNGRKTLKEHKSQRSTSSSGRLPNGLLEFLSHEYEQENRPNVKRILAELAGVFIDKYGKEIQQTTPNPTETNIIETSTLNSETIHSVVDMELDSPVQGLADCDERFRISSPPLLISQPTTNLVIPSLLINTNSNINQTSLTSSNATAQQTNDEILPLNIEVNFINDESKQTNTDSDADNLNDESVKLVIEESCKTKPSSPLRTISYRRRSSDDQNDVDDEINNSATCSSTRKVTILSNNQTNSLIVEAKANINEKDGENEPTVKRIKVELNTPTNEEINPCDKMFNDFDYHHDLDERQRANELINKPPHSLSPSNSTSSYNSPVRESKTRSPLSSSSSRTSSKSNRYRRKQRNSSSDRSYQHHPRNHNNSSSTNSQSMRHQIFNYNHQSVAKHPRFAKYNSPSYSQSTNDLQDIPTLPDNVRDFSRPSYNSKTTNYPFYQDTYINNISYIQPLMSAKPLVDSPDFYDSKPSNTIVRLQAHLDNRIGTTTIDNFSSSSFGCNRSQNTNTSDWSLKHRSR